MDEEIKESIQKIIHHYWENEKKSWEEITGKDFDFAEEECVPHINDNHIFYHLFVLNEFLNENVIFS